MCRLISLPMFAPICPLQTGDVDASFRDADAPIPEAAVFLTLSATRQFGETLLMMYLPHYRTAYNNSPKRLSRKVSVGALILFKFWVFPGLWPVKPSKG